MTIDIASEDVRPFTEWTKLLPTHNGKRVNLATLYRWSNEGCRGIKLEFIQLGARRATSRQALQRFFDALTKAAQGRPVEPMSTRQLKHRKHQIEAAEKRLARSGVYPRRIGTREAFAIALAKAGADVAVNYRS